MSYHTWKKFKQLAIEIYCSILIAFVIYIIIQL